MENRKNCRMSISMTEDMERAIVQLRKDERFTRMSYSEIMRMLIEMGLASINTADQSA